MIFGSLQKQTTTIKTNPKITTITVDDEQQTDDDNTD